MAPVSAPPSITPVPIPWLLVLSHTHNHIYQPKTLTASGDVKHIHSFAVVMSFVRLNQAPVSHTPATSALKEKARGKAFSFLTDFIISALFPIFSLHFSISHFLFSHSNHCYQSGACFREGRRVRECFEREGGRKKGEVPSLMEPSPAPGLISQRLQRVCECVCARDKMNTGKVCLSI